ncbi:hypothetical protein IJ182_10800 [bacterium]|nr:hypothetical protein [bacterium]
MKITSFHQYNNQSFKKLYVSNKNMELPLQHRMMKEISDLYINTDASITLDKMGIDIYAYADKETENKCAKVVFADRDLNIYNLSNGKNYVQIDTSWRSYTDSPKYDISVLKCIDDIFHRVLTKKAKDSKIENEIKEFFKDSDDKHTFVFES